MTDAPDKEKAASDLATRFAAALVMIAVASVAIYMGGVSDVGAWAFRVLVAAAAGVMLYEWGQMHGVPRWWTYIGIALLVVPTLVLPEFYFPGAQSSPAELDYDLLLPAWKCVGIIAVIGLVYGVFSRRLSLGWGYVYVAIPAFSLIVLDWIWLELVFWLMVVVWATDIFAYFAGRGIGGPKLAPRISPNKTWAGLIGGMAGAMVVGAVFGLAFEVGLPFLFLGAPLALLAQLGDLYESSVKRRLGVKDSGAILPGHGGVLDRVDGLLPVTVAVLLILMATLG
jgi:phosphatidate cytidylyltransferase